MDTDTTVGYSGRSCGMSRHRQAPAAGERELSPLGCVAMQIADETRIAELRELVRDVPDFPQPGVLFKDITPLLRSPAGLSLAVEYLTQPFRHLQVDAVVGAESRGFIFGAAVARDLSAGFVPVRKPGRLPGQTRSREYSLEYGSGRMEIHEDALSPGDRVLIIDDLLATGGTLAACCDLVQGLGAQIVGVAVLIELTHLEGRKLLGDYPFYSVLSCGADD